MSDACVGCGYCCRKAPCGEAIRRHPDVLRLYLKGQACPELRWDGKRYWCNLALESPLGGGQGKKAIGAGLGCSSTLFNQDLLHIPSPQSLGLVVPLRAGTFVRVRKDHPNPSRQGKDGVVIGDWGQEAGLVFGFDRHGKDQGCECEGAELWRKSELDLDTAEF